MPHVRIYATAGRTPDEKRALMLAAHHSLVEALGIPEWDQQVRLVELDPANVLLPDENDATTYVLVEVTGYPRSLEVKRELYAALVRNLKVAGVAPDDTKITYHDVPPESWGVQGGIAGSDVLAQGSGNWTAKY